MPKEFTNLMYKSLFKKGATSSSTKASKVSSFGLTMRSTKIHSLSYCPKTRTLCPRPNLALFDTTRRVNFTVDWFKNLAYLAEEKAKMYLATFHPQLLGRIIEFKSKCTVDMTFFDTIFTGVAFIGDLSSHEETHTHRDHVDVCSILIQFRNTYVTGGDTIFFNNKDNESPCFTHKFIHGGYIIGPFNEVVHGSN